MTRYTVTETLPDGRVRTLAAGLPSLAAAMRVYAGVRWAGCIVQVVA